MKKAPEPISEEEFERACQEAPKKGFCLIGIEYINGDSKHPAIFVKEIERAKPKNAIIEALTFVLYEIKTDFKEPLRLFQNGNILRNFTGK
jgi:hypothetical protein